MSAQLASGTLYTPLLSNDPLFDPLQPDVPSPLVSGLLLDQTNATERFVGVFVGATILAESSWFTTHKYISSQFLIDKQGHLVAATTG